MKKSKPFAALSASALALPAISVQSIASAAPDDITIGYRYSQYLEDNMSNASGTTYGSDERYQIGVQQFDISGGYGNVSFNANFQTEHLSGASPQVTLYNTDGSPRIHSTNASIIEDRNEISGSLRYHMPTVEIGVMGGVSDEDDYDSQYGGVNASFEVDNKAITINVGATYAQDTLFPTSYKSTTQVGDIEPDPITEPGRYAAWQQEKAKLSIFTGASFIINRNTVGQVGVSYTNLSGFLSDPYREYLVGNGADRQMYHYDRRPDVRNSFTGSAGIRHHVAAINGTAHGDYRLFVDDWGIVSNTVDLSWYQRINFKTDARSGTMRWLQDTGSYLMLVPQIRYYQQSQANFYTVIAVDANSNPEKADLDNLQYMSTDARLAKFGALSTGGKVILKLGPLALNAQLERYSSQPSFGFNQQDIPTLPNAWRWTTGFDYSF